MKEVDRRDAQDIDDLLAAPEGSSDALDEDL